MGTEQIVFRCFRQPSVCAAESTSFCGMPTSPLGARAQSPVSQS